MIAVTGPRINQGRMLIIIILVVLATLLLSGLINSAYSYYLERAECHKIDLLFTGSAYMFDEADGICKPWGDDAD